MAPTENGGEPERLTGWKEIAKYLDRGERTVQRWEKELGLPIRRMKTLDGQTVYALTRELDGWRARQTVLPQEAESTEVETNASTPSSDLLVSSRRPRASQVALLGAVFVLLAGLIAVSILQPFRRQIHPATLVVVGQKVEARDASERVIWTHSFGREVAHAIGVRRIAATDDRAAEVDLDGDGVVEHIVPVSFSSAGQQSDSTDALFAFSNDGRVLWSVAPDYKFSCGERGYEGPWAMRAIQVSGGTRNRRVWISYVHHAFWPSFVIEVTNGKPTLKYFQAGWIVSLAEWKTPAVTWLAAGGVINGDGYDQPTLALLDEDGPPMVSPYDDSRFDCVGSPTVKPAQVTVLPNLDVARAQNLSYLMVDRLRVVGPRLEAEMGGMHYLATFEPNGRIGTLAFNDMYWRVHQSLEAEGKITHTAINCPEASRPQAIRLVLSDGTIERYSVKPTNTRTERFH